MKNLRAVITADIVNSTLLSRSDMNSLLKSLARQFNTNAIMFGFYRGDSFHALCEVNKALRTVCLLRTLAIQSSDEKERTGIDIRITIGIGTVEEPVIELGTAKGEAFVLSGREMDKLEKTGPRLSMRCPDPKADTALSAISLFADYILSKMTVKQAAVVHELLQGFTQVTVAKKLHKSQSTINKHAGAADWNLLVRLLEVYDNIVNLL